ncbi:serine hydrolase, partial [Streptomyces somaliensis]
MALLALLACGLTASHPAAVPSSALARLVTAGRAPAAALLSGAPGAPGTPGTVRFETTGPAVGRADHFRAGSVTKTFVAVVVLQLAAEGRLAPDDPVSVHAPGL